MPERARRAAGRFHMAAKRKPAPDLTRPWRSSVPPAVSLRSNAPSAVVSLIGVAIMAPVSSFTASYGARLAHALPCRRLEIAFGVFLLVVAARFIASLVW